ncbi:MAG: CRP-like cAMP-binding protein [Myxococcota bacterium]
MAGPAVILTREDRLSIEKLSSLPLFRSVSQDDLTDLLRRAPAQRHPVGAVLFEQGEPAEDAVLLVDGLLEVSVQTAQQNRHVGLIRPGEVAGEQGLFVRGGARNASVMVNQPSLSLRLTPGLLHAGRNNSAVVAIEQQLIATLARRVRSTNLAIQKAWKEESRLRTATAPPGTPTFRERLMSLFGVRS